MTQTYKEVTSSATESLNNTGDKIAATASQVADKLQGKGEEVSPKVEANAAQQNKKFEDSGGPQDRQGTETAACLVLAAFLMPTVS